MVFVEFITVEKMPTELEVAHGIQENLLIDTIETLEISIVRIRFLLSIKVTITGVQKNIKIVGPVRQSVGSKAVITNVSNIYKIVLNAAL